jgi:hypothetical protein
MKTEQVMKLIQIVPSLPPAVDGIGDYALQLAKRLQERHRIESSFLVCDPHWRGGDVGGFRAVKVADRSSAALLQSLVALRGGALTADAPILLHFSPYGYQQRGCPFWLVDGLEEIEAASSGTVNTAFHELDVDCNRPWSSAFWVPRLQQALIRRVGRLGHFRYTNTPQHRAKLEAWGAGPVTLVPNFSTLGEPDVMPPFRRRSRSVVVFGRAAQRRWSYERGGKALSAVCRHLEAESVVDIGPRIPGDQRLVIAGIPINHRGVLDAQEVNRWMESSLASFLYYPIPLLTKSSVYAAGCANGTISFVFDDHGGGEAGVGLIAGEDFIPVRVGEPLPPIQDLQTLSSTVFTNYQGRSSMAAANVVARALTSVYQ